MIYNCFKKVIKSRLGRTHIWPEIHDFDCVRTEKGEILRFYRDFVGNYGNFGEIQAEIGQIMSTSLSGGAGDVDKFNSRYG